MYRLVDLKLEFNSLFALPTHFLSDARLLFVDIIGGGYGFLWLRHLSALVMQVESFVLVLVGNVSCKHGLFHKRWIRVRLAQLL